jgi:hypothetical protein
VPRTVEEITRDHQDRSKSSRLVLSNENEELGEILRGAVLERHQMPKKKLSVPKPGLGWHAGVRHGAVHMNSARKSKYGEP